MTRSQFIAASPPRFASRAIVVDDHPLMATAVHTAVSAMRLFEHVDKATSFAEATRILDEDANFGLAILDLHLRNTSARDNLSLMRDSFPDVPVIVFSGDETTEHISMAFECNVRGYVTKNSSTNVLKAAIQLVLAGGNYVPPEVASVTCRNLTRPPARTTPEPLRLTNRQEQVLSLLLQGMPNKVIASRLLMAEGTVKAHLNSVFRVLNVRTRVEAILRARDLGLV